MSKTVKKVGCSNLKTLIEDEKVIFNDYDIISELTTFIQKHNSFEAEEGCNDDLAMCLVIYAWLVQQDYFKELTDQDVRKRIYEDQRDQIEQDMSPFGLLLTEQRMRVSWMLMEIVGTLMSMVIRVVEWIWIICGITDD